MVTLPGASGSTKLMTVGPLEPMGIVNDWVRSASGGSWNPAGGTVSVTLHVEPDGPEIPTSHFVAAFVVTTPPPATEVAVMSPLLGAGVTTIGWKVGSCA